MLPSDMNLIINPIQSGGTGNFAPLTVFAKSLKNSLANLHETLWLSRPLYKSYFKIKSLRIDYHGNQLIEECLAKNMIKEAFFSKFFLI